jgi:hypothetical protein
MLRSDRRGERSADQPSCYHHHVRSRSILSASLYKVLKFYELYTPYKGIYKFTNGTSKLKNATFFFVIVKNVLLFITTSANAVVMAAPSPSFL